MNSPAGWNTTWTAPGQLPSRSHRRPRIPGPLKTLAFIVMALVVSGACVTGRLAAPNIGNPSDTAPTPAGQRNLPEKELMLRLINTARAEAGIPPVRLGSSPVAQLHAEDMLKHCYISHWGTDGLKPYMRHSLAGGMDPNGENVYSSNECGHVDTWFIWTKDIDDTIREANGGLLASPGHRRTMLNPAYTEVNLGLAWNWTTFKAVQHFRADSVNQADTPRLQEGNLRLRAQLRDREAPAPGWTPILLVVHDPPPRHLYREQLAQTYCYDEGTPAAAVQQARVDRQALEFRVGALTGGHCPDPSQARRLDGRTTFTREHYLLHQSAKARAARETTTAARLAVIDVPEPLVSQGNVRINADLSQVLETHGPGVYTLQLVLAHPNDSGHHLPLLQHALFHETPLSRAQLAWTGLH